MSEEPQSDLVRNEGSVARTPKKLRSSPLFWILSGAIVLFGLGTLVSCLILMSVLNGRDPRAKDVQRYHELQAILDEIDTLRNSPTPDFAAVRKKLEKVRQKMLPELQNEAGRQYPVKQSLLWAVRDDLPRMLQGDLLEVSAAEQQFAANLDLAAQGLGLK